MKHLTILIPHNNINLSSVVGSYEVFSRANKHYESIGRKPVFDIHLAGTSKKLDLYNNFFSIRPDVRLADIRKTDLIIIPALLLAYTANVKKSETLTQWLCAMHKKGAEIASICTGAFLLASTGLLDNKNCSTHWGATNAFREMFPEIKLTPGELITDEAGIYTNGGAFSFLNLLIYLVEKYFDRETAIHCSKVFQIDIERNSQSPFTIFSTQKKHGDEVVEKAQMHIEKRLDEKVSIEYLVNALHVSRRSFDRRFVRATGNTPIEYVQRVKVEAAKKAFESSNKNIHEVMYTVGYNDMKAFREVFKKITGMSPLDYRNRYNKNAHKVNIK